MAILKHIPVKNSDYGEAQRYLLFEHDTRGKLLRDERGDMIPRQGYIQSALNCDPFTYNTECADLNRRYHKNLGKNDVKAHHYIISFDPQDNERGLTPERAHAIAEEFARRFFAGHQVLMVTHPDGHNGSGNIHTHIVFNSLRKENVTFQPFMERPTDALAGYKHHQTRELLMTMFEYLNELCQREHLHTVDVSVPVDRKMTDREYKARQRGQEELDESNREIIYAGLTPRVTEYQTVKDKLREAIDKAAEKAKSEYEFGQLLEKDGIRIKETRGVWSYYYPGRDKPIRARSLGRIYESDEVIGRILGFNDVDMSRPEYEKLPRIFLINSDIRLVTDIQNCVKAQQSAAYARRVEITNLQQMAKAVAYISTNHIGTLQDLRGLIAKRQQEYEELREAISGIYEEIGTVNEDIHNLGVYLTNKKTYTEFLKSPDKGAFRQAHRAEIDAYEAAVTYLKQHYPDKYPTMAELKTRMAKLRQERTHLQSQRFPANRELNTLRTVEANINALLAPHRLPMRGPSL